MCLFRHFYRVQIHTIALFYTFRTDITSYTALINNMALSEEGKEIKAKRRADKIYQIVITVFIFGLITVFIILLGSVMFDWKTFGTGF